MTNQITVQEFIDEAVLEESTRLFLFKGRRVFISTAWGDLLVSHIRWADRDPWAVCPRANGGFGQSFMVCKNTKLSIKGE